MKDVNLVIPAQDYGNEQLVKQAVSRASGISVDEISGLQSVVLFPNPNDGVFTLKLKSSKRIKLDAQLLTASGTEQYNKKGIEVNGASEQVIEVKGLQAGVYYLTLSNKDGKLIRKVLIK